MLPVEERLLAALDWREDSVDVVADEDVEPDKAMAMPLGAIPEAT